MFRPLAQVLLFLLAICLMTVHSANKNKQKKSFVLKSPKFQGVNVGDWGPWDRCPAGEYAASVQYKIQLFLGKETDDSGLNAIKFKCAKPNEHDYSKAITSKQGKEGDWGSEMPCEGIINGFQVEGEEYRSGWDCAAITNLNVSCTGPQGHLVGEGHKYDGLIHWTKEQKCLKNQAICGIRTRVSDTQSDKCGVTEVHMECCEITKAKLCEHPSDDWVLLVECDNRDGIVEFKCKFVKTKGVHDSRAESSGKQTETTNSASAGVSAEANYLAVSATFRAELSTSKTTGHQWSKETSSTFSEETTHEVEFNVPPGVRTQLKQIVGSCGPITVYTGIYKKVDTLKNKKTTTVNLKVGDNDAATVKQLEAKTSNNKAQPGKSESPNRDSQKTGAQKRTTVKPKSVKP